MQPKMMVKNFFCHHKNSLIFICFIFFSIFLCPSQAVSDFLSPEERKWILEHNGKIRVAPDPYYPPLEYFDENGIFRGIAADYIRLIEKKLEITFQIIQLSSFEEILEKAQNREIDIVNTVIKTPERSEYLLFTPPYIRIPNVLVARNDFRDNITIKDLKGIDGIVYQGGYAIGSFLKQQHGITHAQPITDPMQALRELSMGRTNVMAGNLAVISYYVQQMKLANLRITGDCNFDDAVSFASRSDWPILNRILDKVLLEISPEEREAISDKWIKLDVKKFYQDRRFWLIVFGSLGLFAIIVTLLYAWNRALKNQVGIKTFELKQREESLRKSEEKYRCLVENANEAIVVAQDGRLVFVNPTALELTGYSEQELMSRPFLDFIHPDDKALIAERYQSRLKGIFAPSRYSFRMLGHDGTVKIMEISSVLIDWEEKPATLNFIVDITERKKAETERERLLMAIEQSGESIVITDPDGNIHYVNPAFEKITGYARNEAIGKNPRILKSGTHDTAFYQELWNTITSGQTWNGRIVNKRKDGAFYTEDATISPVKDYSGSIVNYVAVKRDITEHLRIQKEKAELESQFYQAQKIESVGRLAGGVAHDFNNMLGVILGHAEMALDHVDYSHPIYDDLLEIQKAAQRSADLTRQLLAFARKQTIKPRILDLNHTISGMLRMLRRLIGEDINLVFKPGANLWVVKMDPSQIDQILANLAVNARDAIAHQPDTGGGNLTIETQNIVIDETYCSARAGFVPGEYVLLGVSDNGCGMSKEALDNIFEPFFTTKEVGKGTGLGLATIYGIVRQNNGFINVYSEPSEGTSFKIYLPRIKGKDQCHAEIADRVVSGGTETILLVEDEEAILRLGKMILERYGYTVLASASPVEALTMAKEYEGPIHLLITDVVMPGINGKELKDRITTDRPEIKTLFMSGYTANVIAHHGVIEKDVQYLQKPFTIRTLAVRVREVLDKSSPQSS